MNIIQRSSLVAVPPVRQCIVHRLRTLFSDETAVTTLEYVVAACAVVFAAVAAAAAIGGTLIPYLHRVYLVVTLPVP